MAKCVRSYQPAFFLEVGNGAISVTHDAADDDVIVLWLRIGPDEYAYLTANGSMHQVHEMYENFDRFDRSDWIPI